MAKRIKTPPLLDIVPFKGNEAFFTALKREDQEDILHKVVRDNLVIMVNEIQQMAKQQGSTVDYSGLEAVQIDDESYAIVLPERKVNLDYADAGRVVAQFDPNGVAIRTGNAPTLQRLGWFPIEMLGAEFHGVDGILIRRTDEKDTRMITRSLVRAKRNELESIGVLPAGLADMKAVRHLMSMNPAWYAKLLVKEDIAYAALRSEYAMGANRTMIWRKAIRNMERRMETDLPKCVNQFFSKKPMLFRKLRREKIDNPEVAEFFTGGLYGNPP